MGNLEGNCIGWWQQSGFGRQPMQRLHLVIEQDQVSGSGEDIIASFTLQGRIRADGALEMIKQYHQRHSVLYVGRYDGEGCLHGTWDISGSQGKWSIRLLRPASPSSDEIFDILPESPQSP